MSVQIRCENTSLAYEGNEVVKGLDFTVKSGDYLCILGENGYQRSARAEKRKQRQHFF